MTFPNPKQAVPCTSPKVEGQNLNEYFQQAMEPELYAPDELLGGGSKGSNVTDAAPSRDTAAAEQDAPPTTSWFSHWFGLSDARASASVDTRNAALHQPPFVRPFLGMFRD